jgi:hypothetical protein
MIRDTHLALDQVAERATALGWTARRDTSAMNLPLVVVTLPRVFGLGRAFFIFTHYPSSVSWRAIAFYDVETPMRLIRALEGKEVAL